MDISIRKWHTKIIYIIFALALALGLTMVPALPASGHDSVDITANGEDVLEAGFADPPLDVDIRVQVAAAVGDLTYDFTWEYKQNEGDFHGYQDLDEENFPLLFTDDMDGTVGPTADDDITVPFTLGIPGWYRVTVEVYDNQHGGDQVDSVEIRVLGIIPEDIAFDVKGGQQYIAVKGMTENATIEWSLVSGVVLDPADIIVKVPPQERDIPNVGLIVAPGVHWDPSTWDKVGWTEEYAGSGLTGQDWVQGFASIHIEAMARGDIHIFATVSGDPLSNNGDIIFHTEKKWGELSYSVLDLDADTAGIQGPTEYISVAPLDNRVMYETIEDTIYATFYEVIDPMTVGDAIVHWWLFDDTEDNQDLIDELMDHLASQAGWVDPYWQAAGKYNTEWLGDWMADLGYVGPGDREPFDAINFLAKDIADGGLGLHAPTNIFWWDTSIGNPWYNQTVTEDSWPAEDRGVTQSELEIDYGELEECIPESVMIVVLVTYPGSGDPTDDPFNGENIVIIEKGKKTFHKQEVAEVKTPQLRWAGEKILLEKDWSDVINPSQDNGYDYIAVYHLESQSIGELAEAGIPFMSDYEKDAGDIWVHVTADYPASQVILQSEVQGEADVNASLYLAADQNDDFDWDNPSKWKLYGPPIAEIGFLVYYLAFEDVVLAEGVPLDLVAQAGEQMDVTTLASLNNLDPLVDDAYIAVQVRGWFTSDDLPGTARPAVDIDGDGIYDMPAGRYVLPNDWPALAGYNYELRPNWDLMDQAHLDGIVSDDPHGPYDIAVASAGPLGEAEEPNIGPFSTLQQWSVDDLWIAEATTVPTSHIGWDNRNTVVPDGILDWFDAPMPQALVLFQIESYSTAQGEIPAFSDLWKGDLEGYGVENGVMVDPLGLVDDIFQSPFYEVEIASHWVIPGGYNWDSWGDNWPYVYWFDLDIDSIIADTPEVPVNSLDLEVYSDNHGIAAVTLDALQQAGSVTLIAKAEYPYAPKKGKYGPMPSDDIIVQWGAIELNPHFVASMTEVDVGETLIFTNLTEGGTHPYTNADWDFNADGIPEIALTGTEAEVMIAVPYAYATPGLYTVRLTMTDSTPTTRHEDRIVYILVAGEAVLNWEFPVGGVTLISPNPGQGRPLLNVPVDPDEITVSAGAQLWGIYYFDETALEWLYYIPGFTSTLTLLEPGEFYYVVVSTACTLTIPQES